MYITLYCAYGFDGGGAAQGQFFGAARDNIIENYSARGGRSDICSDCSNNVCHALLCVFVSPAYYNVRSGALLKNGYSFRWLSAKRSRHINLSSTNNTIPRKSNRQRIGKIYGPGRFATTLCGIYLCTHVYRTSCTVAIARYLPGAREHSARAVGVLAGEPPSREEETRNTRFAQEKWFGRPDTFEIHARVLQTT